MSTAGAAPAGGLGGRGGSVQRQGWGCWQKSGQGDGSLPGSGGDRGRGGRPLGGSSLPVRGAWGPTSLWSPDTVPVVPHWLGATHGALSHSPSRYVQAPSWPQGLV